MARSDKLTPPAPDEFILAMRERLHYDPTTGHFTFRYNGRRAGCLDKSTGYVRIRLWNKLYHAHRLAWAYVTGAFPEEEVDHRDRVRHHNWFSNLRKATHVQNAYNKDAPRTNTSGIKGVSFDKTRNRWKATIRVQGKWRFLGRFDTSEEAEAVYLRAANDLQGEFFPVSRRG